MIQARHNLSKYLQIQSGATAIRIRRPGLTARQWLSLLLLLSGVILFPERPAWGSAFNVTVESGGISGYAQQAPLGVVLGRLAEQGGYTVYIDESLAQSLITFNIPTALPAEKAVQRMVHPHSYAMVFTKIPGRQELAVEEIKVYAKGNQSASFLTMSANQDVYRTSSYARSGSSANHDRSSGFVQAGSAAARKHVKAPLNITKSSMGFTGFDFRDRYNGPDYRPDSLAAAKAYADYREERNAMALRAKDAQLQAAKQSTENGKSAYRTQRDASIQQTISQSSN